MKEYDQILKKNKMSVFRKKRKQGLVEQTKGWVLGILDNFRTHKHLVTVHRKNLHKTVLRNETENQEDNVHESITALSGVIIGILSLYFRDGKKSGFRIPKTLRANWARVK